jgi:hypothetical protein
MGHVVSRQPWGTIDVDTTAGRVFLQQDWRYHWAALPPAAPWTLAEKRSFHHETDRRIWGRWSNRIRLRVSGAAEFSRRFAVSQVPINFDVRWVTTGGQWRVNANKTPPGTSVTAYHQSVNFGARIINLYTSKLSTYTAANDNGVSRPGFRSTPHEFGHALGNPDEYLTGSPHLPDAASTMTIGNQIRDRHLALVLTTLNTMIPGCVFSM